MAIIHAYVHHASKTYDMNTDFFPSSYSNIEEIKIGFIRNSIIFDGIEVTHTEAVPQFNITETVMFHTPDWGACVVYEKQLTYQ